MRNDVLPGIDNAKGLKADDAETLKRLVRIFESKTERNNKLLRFYEDKNRVEFLGVAVPQDVASRIGCRVGWAAKSVDYLASRSIIDGLTAVDEEVQAALQSVMIQNRVTAEYEKGVTSELIFGCGFWTISKGGKGDPAVVVNFHNAQTSAAMMDTRRKIVRAGFVIEDTRPSEKNPLAEEPCLVVMHTAENVIIISRGNGDTWAAEYRPHILGRPAMEAMCYRPTDCKLGKSRISRTVMDIVLEAQREICRLAYSSEVAAQPLRYMLNAPDAAYDMPKNTLAYNTMLLAGKDPDGDLPVLGELTGADPSPHIAIMEHLINRLAGETGIPATSLGLSNSGVYQSADSLHANMDDLILEAEALNRSNGEAMVNIAKMALAILNNKSVADIADLAESVSVHWRNPAMPSLASQSDAMVKQASVAEWLPDTDVYWESLGYSEEQRMRLAAGRRRYQGRMTANDVLEVARNEAFA